MWGLGSSTEKRVDGASVEELSTWWPDTLAAIGMRCKSKSVATAKPATDGATHSVEEPQPTAESSYRQTAALVGEMDTDESPADLAEETAADVEGSRGGSPGLGQLRAAASTPPLKESNARAAQFEQAWPRRSPTPSEEVEMPSYWAAAQAVKEGDGFTASRLLPSSARWIRMRVRLIWLRRQLLM